jgi:hypothetical protein
MGRDDPRRSAPQPDVLSAPQIRLLGRVEEKLVEELIDGLGKADPDADLAIELTTQGGDAELGRRMALEIADARKRRKGRTVFLGKTEVYSAGVTVMSAFPREDRFLTRDCVLLIHCRQLDQTVELQGPLRGSLPQVRALCRQLEVGIELEKEGFEQLIAGSEVTMDELLECALHNWYVRSEDAVERKLVAGLLD